MDLNMKPGETRLRREQKSCSRRWCWLFWVMDNCHWEKRCTQASTAAMSWLLLIAALSLEQRALSLSHLSGIQTIGWLSDHPRCHPALSVFAQFWNGKWSKCFQQKIVKIDRCVCLGFISTSQNPQSAFCHWWFMFLKCAQQAAELHPLFCFAIVFLNDTLSVHIFGSFSTPFSVCLEIEIKNCKGLLPTSELWNWHLHMCLFRNHFRRTQDTTRLDLPFVPIV